MKKKKPRNSITFYKELKRGRPNLKRGQKRKKLKFYYGKKGAIYVPKDKREKLEELSMSIFGSKHKYRRLAWKMQISLEKIEEMLEEANNVKINLLKGQLENAIRKSKETRSEETNDATTTTDGDSRDSESP